MIIEVEITEQDIINAKKNSESLSYTVYKQCLLAVSLSRHFGGIANVGYCSFDINGGKVMYIDSKGRGLIDSFDFEEEIEPCTIKVSDCLDELDWA